MSALGIALIIHVLGVLVCLALILFGVVSVTIIQESHVKKWKWSDSSHPKTLEMLRKDKEAGMFDLGGGNCVETKKEKNPNRG
jgi:hypothetical protein